MKLTKADLKIQKQVDELLKKDKLTPEDKEYIFENFYPASISNIAQNSAYFTPLELAYDFALFAPKMGVCVDMCAGIGVLSHACKIRDKYDGNITHQICIERCKEYIPIGQKLLPDAEWIHGDVFDKVIWDDIIKRYGKIDCIISNPPFGKISKSDADLSWLKYKGAEIDMMAIEVALMFTDNISMILPVQSCDFQYSGRPYYKEVENRKTRKLKNEIGVDFHMACSGVDTTAYEQFKGANVRVECVDIHHSTNY